MNHTQQIIQDAVEGGWQPCDIIVDYNKIIITHTNGGFWIKNDPEEDGCHIEHSQMLLQPSFWQAAGKTRGWGEELSRGKARDWFSHVLAGDDIDTALSKLI